MYTVSIGSVDLSTVLLPRQRPLPAPKAKLVEHFMSPGAAGPGVRKIEFLGAHISYADWGLTAQRLSTSQLSALESLFYAGQPVTVTIELEEDEVTVFSHSYKMFFREDGFVPGLMGPDVEYTDDMAYTAAMTFMVLEQLT